MVIVDYFYYNSEWKIKYVLASLSTQSYYGTPSFISYEIKVKRNSNYFFESAINPLIFVTTIACLSLWLKDLQSRIIVSVISILSIISVLWIVSSYIPKAANNSWLGEFSLFCFLLILLVSIETSLASYFWNKKQKNPPKCLKFLVLISLPFKFISFISGKPFNEESLEMGEIIENENKLETPLIPYGQYKADLTEEELEKRRRILYSWKRASLSLDRIFRVIIIFIYSIGLIVFFSRISY